MSVIDLFLCCFVLFCVFFFAVRKGLHCTVVFNCEWILMEPKKNWHKKFKTPIFVWRTRDITPNEGERLKPWITNTWNSNNASNEQTDDSLSEMKRYQTNWNKNKFASHTAMAAATAIKTDIRMLASKQKRKRTKQTDDYDDKRWNERHALCVRSIEMPISSLVFLLSVFLLGSCFQQKKKLVLWVNQTSYN